LVNEKKSATIGDEIAELLGRDVLAGVVMPVGVKLREHRRRVFLLASHRLWRLPRGEV